MFMLGIWPLVRARHIPSRMASDCLPTWGKGFGYPQYLPAHMLDDMRVFYCGERMAAKQKMNYFCFYKYMTVKMCADSKTANAGSRINTWLKRMNLFGLILFSNKSFLLIVSVLSLLNLAACSRISDGKEHRRHVIAELMDSAEVIMNDEPEMAFRFMDSIDSHSISGRERKARYALLYSEAQYKYGIDAADDSLVMIAVRYYSISKNLLNRFRSYYMLGCTYNALGQLTNAAVALGQAELLTDNFYDEYRLGLLYSQLGDVFFYSFDFRRAEHYYRMAMENYTKAGKEKHQMHALYDICGCLIQNKDYDAAHSILMEVYEWANNHNETAFASSCLQGKIMCSLNTQSIETATAEFDEYVSNYGQPVVDNPYIYSLFAAYYMSTDRYIDATHFIEKGWNYAKTKNDSIDLWYNESLLDEFRGRSDSALVKYKHSIELQNQNLYTLLDQPVLGAQNDYLKTLAEKEALKAKHNHTVVLFMAILIVLIISLFIIVNRIRKVNNEKEKQDYLLTIKELRLKEDTNNEIINQLNKKVNILFSKQYAELDRIFDKMMEIEENQELASVICKNQTNKVKDNNLEKADILYSHIKKQLEELGLKKNQKKIDSIIDATFNNLMTRIKDSRFKMADEEIKIIRFSLIGFSVKTINKITGLTPKYIYQRRDRAIQKISRISPETQQELYNILK